MEELSGAGTKAGPVAVLRAETGPEAKLNVLTLLRLREQLKQQLMEYRAAACANRGSYLDYDVEQISVMRPMQNLEGALEEIKISFKNKTLCVQRMQLVDALRNKMTQNDDDERRLIVETMEHTVKLSKAILESQQQTRVIEEKLNDIRKKRLKKNEHPNTFLQERNAVSGKAAFFPFLKQAEEDKLLQIRDVKKKKEVANMKVAEILESVHKNLQTERAMATVIQNVFQNIIIGSRVNWAEDPSLKAIVLQLEKSIFI